PASAYFFNRDTELRIDLLFDFPVAAAKLAARATRTTIRSHAFDIASEQDLLHLKRIAKSARSAPGDAEDISFLEARQTRSWCCSRDPSRHARRREHLGNLPRIQTTVGASTRSKSCSRSMSMATRSVSARYMSRKRPPQTMSVLS